MSKNCTKCKEQLPLTSFSKDSSRSDGHSYMCKPCVKVKASNYYKSNKEQILAASKEYYESNRESVKDRHSKHFQDNREMYYAKTARWRKSVRNAAVPWSDKADIDRIYAVCRRISERTGVKHHVDHTIPLQGDNVCGLHVPSNLRIIPAKMNLQKGNKYEQ